MAATKGKTPKEPAAKSDGAARFELDGQTLEFKLDDLTFGEVEFVEEYFGCPLDLVPWESGRGSLIGAYLAMHRKDKKVTLDDLRPIKIAVLKRVGDNEQGDDAEDPPSGEGKAP